MTVAPRLVLLGRAGCHLCDDARAVVADVAAQTGVGWTERDVLEDPELAGRYAEYVPVLLLDGVPHDFFRVDADRLRAALDR
jgi:hypothetical protein